MDDVLYYTKVAGYLEELESLRAENVRLRAALCGLVGAYRTFVDAHGPLTDFATNAEMVDFDIACAAALAAAVEEEATDVPK